MRTVFIHVIGHVQGVYYRATAKEVADQFGVKGVVRNERDRSVYIEAQGSDEAIREFIAWCRRGPVRARVEEVRISEGNEQVYSDFKISR